MRRGLPAALALALAACTSGDAASCPGEPVGTWLFTVTGTFYPDGVPALFCEKPAQDASQVVGAFRGTLSSDPSLGTAALCIQGAGDLGQPYFGRVEAGVYTLNAVAGLAVLTRCGTNCSASAALRIQGEVTAAGFEGTLTETFTAPQGDCGACAFPCEKTYGLEGVP